MAEKLFCSSSFWDISLPQRSKVDTDRLNCFRTGRKIGFIQKNFWLGSFASQIVRRKNELVWVEWQNVVQISVWSWSGFRSKVSVVPNCRKAYQARSPEAVNSQQFLFFGLLQVFLLQKTPISHLFTMSTVRSEDMQWEKLSLLLLRNCCDTFFLLSYCLVQTSSSVKDAFWKDENGFYPKFFCIFF